MRPDGDHVTTMRIPRVLLARLDLAVAELRARGERPCSRSSVVRLALEHLLGRPEAGR